MTKNKFLSALAAVAVGVTLMVGISGPAQAAPPAGVDLTYTISDGVVTYTATNTGNTLAAGVFARYNTEDGTTVQSGPFGGWYLAPGQSVVVGSTPVEEGNGVVLKATVYQDGKNGAYSRADAETVAGSK